MAKSPIIEKWPDVCRLTSDTAAIYRRMAPKNRMSTELPDFAISICFEGPDLLTIHGSPQPHRRVLALRPLRQQSSASLVRPILPSIAMLLSCRRSP